MFICLCPYAYQSSPRRLLGKQALPRPLPNGEPRRSGRQGLGGGVPVPLSLSEGSIGVLQCYRGGFGFKGLRFSGVWGR